MIGHSSLLRVIRRGSALLALFSVLAPFEPLLPDAHDEDAVAATLVGTPIDPAGQHPTAPVPTPEHRTHVDHCAHVHLLTVVVREQVTGPCAPAGQVFDTSSPVLASISAPPHQRPPIA